jgi:tRNA-dihydrouridine synthase
MIGRAAMGNPWIFAEIKAAMYPEATAFQPPTMTERWELIVEHCRSEIRLRKGEERRAIHGMRSRLMAYTKGMIGGRQLREAFSRVESVTAVEDIAAQWLSGHSQTETLCE